MDTGSTHWPDPDLQERHARQRRLCVALESIADGLPDAVKPCMLATARALIADYLQLVEQVDMRAEGCGQVLSGQLAGQMLEERRKDVFIAEEVADALSAWSRGEDRLAPDALGYLLRNLFDRLRQQMALEAGFLARLSPDHPFGLH